MPASLRRHPGILTRVFTLIGIAVLMASAMLTLGPGRAHADQCAPPGINSASAAPTNLDAAASHNHTDTYTTPGVIPINQIDKSKLNLQTPGTLTVGTLSDAPPNICLNSANHYTGMDNELLKAVAAKLGLNVRFVGTEFSGLLAQVANHRFDVGSSSITTTAARRQTVDFTNGYDFGYFALVVPTDSPIHSFSDAKKAKRIGVVQGTVQEDYVVNTMHMQPVTYPDYNTVYSSLKTGQIDAWVAPSQQAQGAIRPGDAAKIVQNTYSVDNFIGWAVAKDNKPLTAALNSGLDAIIDDGTWGKIYSEWAPRELPPGWKPGSKASTVPPLPNFAAIAAKNRSTARTETTAKPKSVLTQLKDSFLSWDLYKKAFPELLTTGLPNTLILTVVSGIVGLIIGLILAVAGISKRWFLRLPARIYTDIFRGLPEVVVILIIGLGVGPIVKNLTGSNPYPLGIAALGLIAGAYFGEILRSGIQSVDTGQMEAARALGFGYRKAMQLIIIPQGVRRVLPALMNQLISLLKATSLVYFLGLVADQRELFQIGRDFNAQTGNLSPLVAAGIVYLIFTIPLTHIVNWLDKRMRDGKAATVDSKVQP